MNELLWIVAALFAMVLLAILVLLIIRVGSGILDRRHTAERARIRELVMTVVMGDGDESTPTVDVLGGLRGGASRRAVAQVFGLLPKISGEARGQLVEVLCARGEDDRAWRLLQSWSAVRRCRGAHRLGALRAPGAVEPLVELLGDRVFIVRRVSLRALGSIGDPAAVLPILVACGNDRSLSRDLLAALHRVGSAGTPALRAHLARGLDTQPDTSTEMAVTALGLIGDYTALAELTGALEARSPLVQAAAAEALGRIGAPSAVERLVDQLDNPIVRVRRSAARALGEIGEPGAAEGLGRALVEADRVTSRLIAGALLKLGPRGRDVLLANTSPYAAEALAVAALRGAA